MTSSGCLKYDFYPLTVKVVTVQPSNRHFEGVYSPALLRIQELGFSGTNRKNKVGDLDKDTVVSGPFH